MGPAKWGLYGIAWLAAAIVWSAATAASFLNQGIVLPGLLVRASVTGAAMMATGALLGVFVWRLSGSNGWRPGARWFIARHALALIVYAALVAAAGAWPAFLDGRAADARFWLSSAPVLYNLVTGAGLYLVVAGVSHAVRLQDRLRGEEAAAAEAQVLAQQAQLATLRAQINPHFLFNALHTVGALIHTDPKGADRALERLGDLLRYALGAEAEVPFAQEWRFTQDYLEFQRLRLGDRLRVDLAIDPSAYDASLPPLVLQPLVENAVRYGIDEDQAGGRITLRAKAVDGRLLVSVANDCRQAPPEDGLGMGVESVTRRLRATYGQAASLRIHRAPPGFVVELTVPLRRSGPAAGA